MIITNPWDGPPEPTMAQLQEAVEFWKEQAQHNLDAIQAVRPEAVVKAEALEEAAVKLERLARWRFEAGKRIWAWSDYGRKDWQDDRPGEKGLMLCGEAGQMERDANRLRGKPERRRRNR